MIQKKKKTYTEIFLKTADLHIRQEGSVFLNYFELEELLQYSL